MFYRDFCFFLRGQGGFRFRFRSGNSRFFCHDFSLVSVREGGGRRGAGGGGRSGVYMYSGWTVGFCDVETSVGFIGTFSRGSSLFELVIR